MQKILHFLKTETVLVIAAIAAILSMFAVPPSAEYYSYIDFRVLALLFCLMAVVAGIQKAGLFDWLAQRLLHGERNIRLVCLVLVLLPFFFSMLVTNDVALLTFVPFAIMVLRRTNQNGRLIYIVVLQTIAANLGSMLTPFGNPQNLFLYSFFEIENHAFFSLTLPPVLLSLLLLLPASLLGKGAVVRVQFSEPVKLEAKKHLLLHLALFLLCLSTVFHLLHWGITLAIVCLALLLFDRSIFRRVDYGLLITFVCFFIFAGNIGRMEPVRQLLSSLLQSNTLLVSAAASQIISNVPAAVLLSGFTADHSGLLLGTNIGGLGTLIASLASLISFKLYTKTPDARPARYLGIFTLLNLLFLLLLLLQTMF